MHCHLIFDCCIYVLCVCVVILCAIIIMSGYNNNIVIIKCDYLYGTKWIIMMLLMMS